MEKKFSARYRVEGLDPSASSVYTDSNKFNTQEEAVAFGELVYWDAFVDAIQVSGDEPF